MSDGVTDGDGVSARRHGLLTHLQGHTSAAGDSRLSTPAWRIGDISTSTRETTATPTRRLVCVLSHAACPAHSRRRGSNTRCRTIRPVASTLRRRRGLRSHPVHCRDHPVSSSSTWDRLPDTPPTCSTCTRRSQVWRGHAWSRTAPRFLRRLRVRSLVVLMLMGDGAIHRHARQRLLEVNGHPRRDPFDAKPQWIRCRESAARARVQTVGAVERRHCPPGPSHQPANVVRPELFRRAGVTQPLSVHAQLPRHVIPQLPRRLEVHRACQLADKPPRELHGMLDDSTQMIRIMRIGRILRIDPGIDHADAFVGRFDRQTPSPWRPAQRAAAHARQAPLQLGGVTENFRAQALPGVEDEGFDGSHRTFRS